MKARIFQTKPAKFLPKVIKVYVESVAPEQNRLTSRVPALQLFLTIMLMGSFSRKNFLFTSCLT